MENKNAQPAGGNPGMGDAEMAVAKAAAIESILEWELERKNPETNTQEKTTNGG